MNAELYDALLAANVPDDQARRAAASVIERDQAATKADLVELENRLIKWVIGIVGVGVAIVSIQIQLII